MSKDLAKEASKDFEKLYRASNHEQYESASKEFQKEVSEHLADPQFMKDLNARLHKKQLLSADLEITGIDNKGNIVTRKDDVISAAADYQQFLKGHDRAAHKRFNDTLQEHTNDPEFLSRLKEEMSKRGSSLTLELGETAQKSIKEESTQPEPKSTVSLIDRDGVHYALSTKGQRIDLDSDDSVIRVGGEGYETFEVEQKTDGNMYLVDSHGKLAAGPFDKVSFDRANGQVTFAHKNGENTVMDFGSNQKLSGPDLEFANQE